MKRSEWFKILLLEILVIFAVTGLFQTLDRQIAGLIGGVFFILLGAFLYLRLFRSGNFVRTITFWWLQIYFFLTVLPVFVIRVMNWGRPFNELTILGVSATTYHHLAEGVYLGLMLATIIDLIRARILR
jgi:hypothetical protein